ncbi:MAG: LysE family translocator [Acidovorax sp.]|nr:LysE family translocator [Acidovorax sp.]
MPLALLLSYVLSIVLLIATPGPVVAYITQVALQQGRGVAWRTALGTSSGALVLMALAALAVGGVLVLRPEALAWLGLAGSVFLMVLAGSGLRDWAAQPRENVDTAAVGAAKPAGLGGWQRGFLVAVANPKDILFFAALFPQFLHGASAPMARLGLLAAIWVGLDLLILAAYIAAAQHPRVQRHQRLLALLSLLILLVMGLLAAGWSVWALWS